VTLLSDKAFSTFEEAKEASILAAQDFLDREEGFMVVDIKAL
jgi:hypothetical protein